MRGGGAAALRAGLRMGESLHALGSGVRARAWGGQGISPVSVFPVGRDASAMDIHCGGRLSLVLRSASHDLCSRGPGQAYVPVQREQSSFPHICRLPA
jgi:hypothetical protein